MVNGLAASKQKPTATRTKLTKDALRAYWNIAPKGGENAPDKAVGDIIHMLSTDAELLAKAQPDGCYNGFGEPDTDLPCTAPAIPKVNQGYIWGMTKVGDEIWFGTMSNTFCAVFGTLAAQFADGEPITGLPPTASCVCEFADAAAPWWMFGGWPPTYPDQLKDVRPPEMYSYNTVTKTLTPRNAGLIDYFLRQVRTLGFRAAGSLGDVVFFAGPSIDNQSIYMFAFQASNGNYLGSHQFTAYNNIRKFVVVNGVLYTGVGVTGGGGAVLRWTGSVSDPFQFEVVGNIDASVAELAEHNGRVFVTTWPETITSSALAGLWMSPTVPAGGLTSADAGNWTEAWRVDNYEPDPVTARVYGGGALASFDGYLWWGTMHIPFLASMAQVKTHGEDDFTTAENDIALLLGSHRSTSIFRGRDFGQPTQEIKVAYGMPLLPVYTPRTATEAGFWTLLSNNNANGGTSDPNPLFGPSGLGNFFNAYTWSMAVFDNRLWVGTMDWSYMVNDWLPLVFSSPDFQIPLDQLPLRPSLFGADLFFFADAAIPAIPETLGGVGNYTNYGIRNMLADDKLYVGTANPMNLLTNTTDNLPEGGWELIGLTARTPNTPAGTNVEVTTTDGIHVTFCSVAVPGYTGSTALPDVTALLNTLPWVNILAPTGYAIPNPVFLLGTSAFWRYTCSTENLAQVCVPSTDASAHIFQLQYGEPGQTIWTDITSTSSGPGMVCGAITRGFIGVIGLAGLPPPTITALNPSPFITGNQITLTGSGYTVPGLGVTFNGITATSFNVVDDTTLTAIVPGGLDPGAVTIEVTTNGGSATIAGVYAQAGPTSIPTLSEWGLILLATALSAAALFSLRRRTLPPPA